MLPTPTVTPEVLSIIPPVSAIPVWFEEIAKWVLLAIAVITGIVSFAKLISKPLKSIDEKIDKVDGKVDAVDTKVGVLQDDMADVQCTLLNQAHDHYVDKGSCPPDIKELLSKMCDNYTQKGHNHIRPRYRDTLLKLPDYPPPKRKRSASAREADGV